MTGKRRGVRGSEKKVDKNYRTRQLLFFFFLSFFYPLSLCGCAVSEGGLKAEEEEEAEEEMIGWKR